MVVDRDSRWLGTAKFEFA